MKRVLCWFGILLILALLGSNLNCGKKERPGEGAAPEVGTEQGSGAQSPDTGSAGN